MSYRNDDVLLLTKNPGEKHNLENLKNQDTI